MAYREGPLSTLSHNGKLYSVDKLLEIAEGVKSRLLPVSSFEWVVEEINKDTPLDTIRRINEADLRIPIIAIKENRQWIPLDGYHRVCKAVRTKRIFIQTKELTETQLSKALLK